MYIYSKLRNKSASHTYHKILKSSQNNWSVFFFYLKNVLKHHRLIFFSDRINNEWIWNKYKYEKMQLKNIHGDDKAMDAIQLRKAKQNIFYWIHLHGIK